MNSATPVRAETSSVDRVASSATVVTLLAANTERKGAIFYNDSTAALYLKLGSAASYSSFSVKIDAGSYADISDLPYTGIVTGLWASANGYCYVTELY